MFGVEPAAAHRTDASAENRNKDQRRPPVKAIHRFFVRPRNPLRMLASITPADLPPG